MKGGGYMIIKDITAHTVRTDYKGPWQHDKRFYVKTGEQANTIIVVRTDSDIIGIGETRLEVQRILRESDE